MADLPKEFEHELMDLLGRIATYVINESGAHQVLTDIEAIHNVQTRECGIKVTINVASPAPTSVGAPAPDHKVRDIPPEIKAMLEKPGELAAKVIAQMQDAAKKKADSGGYDATKN